MAEHAGDLLEAASWELASSPPNGWASPDALDAASGWNPAPVPGTVAQALCEQAGAIDLDARDWWYRTRVAVPPPQRGMPAMLAVDGLATLAEVWVDGRAVLASDNMFRRHVIGIDALGDVLDLHLVLRALGPRLAARHPRPHWKTALVAQQNLRWYRSALLGRIPAWSGASPVIGPWRPLRALPLAPLVLEHATVRGALDGSRGLVNVRATARVALGNAIEAAWLELDGQRHELVATAASAGAGAWHEVGLAAELSIDAPRAWWPHTHGEPVCYEWSIVIACGGAEYRAGRGRIGFKSIELDRTGAAVRLRVNDVAVFCRGACWTSADPVGHTADERRLRAILTVARDAGFNMIRVGGTMVYESDAFYALCDELGLMVWQDFMFANMDYPFDDPAFAATVEAEVQEQLARLASRVSIAVYCGNSEIEQQAAMRGVERAHWRHRFFAETLPELCAASHPGIPFFPSTPCEGPLPFHTGSGLAHYFGLGAYQRDLADLSVANVRFAPECLGFSNVPDETALVRHFGAHAPQTHHPAWKRGVPRDAGSGWDFEDIRDHYLQLMFGVDPARLRYMDGARYLELSRIVSGELMAQAFAFWRGPASGCGGALVWTLLDLVPGAGWGLIGSDGAAKPALCMLARHLQPVQVLLVERGLDGHAVTVINERGHALEACLRLELWQTQGAAVAVAERAVNIGARGSVEIAVDELFGRFLDTAFAYRFGPSGHCALSATLLDAAGARISETVLRTRRSEPEMVRGVVLEARLDRDAGVLCLRSDTLLFHACIDLPGHVLADNYLCLLPGREYRIGVSRGEGPGGRGQLVALNTRQVFGIAAADEY